MKFKSKSKVTIFDKNLQILQRINPEMYKAAKSGRGWKGKMIDLAILGQGGSNLNRGKETFTACAGKVKEDLKQIGLTVGKRTIERRISVLKKEKMLKIEEQGFVRRKKGLKKNGKTYRTVTSFKATVYSLTKKALEFLNKLTNNFFCGIKKHVKEVIFNMKRFLYLKQQMQLGKINIGDIDTREEYQELYRIWLVKIESEGIV